MIYQLPSGKIIHLSINVFLSLSDDELNQLDHTVNGMDAPTKMHYGSQSEKESLTIDEPPDKTLDYKDDNSEGFNTESLTI